MVFVLFGFAGFEAKAEVGVFPDVGSYKVTQTIYHSTGQEARTSRSRVIDVVDGRPIIHGSIGGTTGIIFETDQGVIVAEDECRIQPADFQAPRVPNVCGWTPCTVEVGQKIVRNLTLYSVRSRSKCQPEEGEVVAHGLRRAKIEVPGLGEVDVVETDMQAKLGSWFITFNWTASIAAGFGEVLGREGAGGSINKETMVLEAKFIRREFIYTPTAVEEVKKRPILEQPTNSRVIEGEIIAFGDSLTAGYGASPEESYPAQLERLLRASGLSLTVCNAGVTGETSSGARQRLIDMMKAKPRLVLVGLGANDVLQGGSPETLYQNITAIVKALKDQGIKVVLLGLETDEVKTAYAQALRGTYERIAQEEDVPLVPFMLAGVLGQPKLLSSDGMHPNGLGYKVVAETVFPLIIKFFQAKGTQAVSLSQ